MTIEQPWDSAMKTSKKGSIHADGAHGEAAQFERCEWCGSEHPKDLVFCPVTGVAIKGKRDDFVGVELEVGKQKVEILKPLWRTLGSAFYKGWNPRQEPLLVKKFSVELLPHEQGDPDKLDEVGGLKARFAQEISSLEKHSDLPFIPNLVGSGVHKEEPFLVLSWVQGSTVREALDRVEDPGQGEDIDEKHEGFTLDRAVNIALELSSAIRVLHRRHFCHRDLKPENLLIEKRTGSLFLVDFGSSKDYAQKSGTKALTRNLRDLPTTSRYVPGELRDKHQAPVDETVGKRLDVFAAGRIITELLFGALTLKKVSVDTPLLTRSVENAVSAYSGPVSKAILELVGPFTEEGEREEGREENKNLSAAGLCHSVEQVRSVPEFALESIDGPVSEKLSPALRKKRAVAQDTTSKHPAVGSQSEVEKKSKVTKVSTNSVFYLGIGLLIILVFGVFVFLSRTRKGKDGRLKNGTHDSEKNSGNGREGHGTRPALDGGVGSEGHLTSQREDGRGASSKENKSHGVGSKDGGSGARPTAGRTDGRNRKVPRVRIRTRKKTPHTRRALSPLDKEFLRAVDEATRKEKKEK